MSDKYLNAAGVRAIKNYIDTNSGDENVIETVQRNGTTLPIQNKTVNISTPRVSSKKEGDYQEVTIKDSTGNIELRVCGRVSPADVRTMLIDISDNVNEWFSSYELGNKQYIDDGDQALQDQIDDIGPADDSTYGMVKTNPSESVTLNANGQLDIGGRLGQMSNSTGVYSPKTINPASIGKGSFLLTEASGTNLGSKSLAVSTGTGITLKTAAAAGATQYTVANNYANRIICASAIGATVAVDEETAATNYATITSVTINGQSFTPDSSANSSTNNIIITVDRTINPDKSLSSVRVYFDEGTGNGFSNLFVGQAVGGKGGASVVVGQKVFSSSGNACAIVGADMYNTGNGNALFGRQHISRKNRSFLAGTGHDTTNAKSECVAALGQWSDISSDTAFAIGNGTSHTARSNLFEIKNDGTIYVNGTKLNVP